MPTLLSAAHFPRPARGTGPFFLDNLAEPTSHRTVADTLRGALLDWLERVGGKRPVVEAAAPRPAGRRLADPLPSQVPWEVVRFGHRQC